MIFLILLGAELLNGFFALSRLPSGAAAWIEHAELGPMAVMLLLLAIFIVFGCFMDSLSMIVLAVPFFWPMLSGIDFGMSSEALKIWFGIIALVTVELGLITPPVGLNVFIIHGLAEDIPMSETFKGVLPFFLAEIVRVTLLIAFPGIVLFLPELLG
jgi:TRAP-type C4-dicarboxylate transport system permease large subunit